MKKIVAGFLCLLLLVSGNVVTHASPATPGNGVAESERNITVVPFWQNVSLVTVCLSFDGSKGSLDGYVFGQQWVTSITVNAVLERLNADGTYSHVNSWNGMTANDKNFFWDTTYYVAKGHTYRLTLTATAVGNGYSETISLSKSATAN